MLTSQAVKDAELLECRVGNIKAEYEHKVSEMSCRLEQVCVIYGGVGLGYLRIKFRGVLRGQIARDDRQKVGK